VLRFKARRRQSPALKPQGELTASERRVIRLLDEAMQAVARQAQSQLTRIADAVAHKPESAVADLVTVDPWYELQRELEAELLAEYLDAGSRVQLPAIQKATLNFAFDRDRPESAAWARAESANLVREITDGQRQTIRDVIVFGQEQGLSPQDTARRIQQSVGLTSQQAGWVDSFYQRSFAQAIDGGATLAQAAEQAQSAAERYQTQVHRYRSMTIARTEIMRANSQGRQAAWDQGLTGGWISPTAQKEWIAEADACDICSPVNGTRVGVKDRFPIGEPPAHPNCRCDVLLIPDAVPADLAGMSDAQLDDLIAQGLTGGPIPGMGQAVRIGDTEFEEMARFSGKPHIQGRTPDGRPIFSPERAALHDDIIARILDPHEGTDSPTFTMLGGGPASGKTTALGKMAGEGAKGVAKIDPDEIKGMLPEYRTMVDAGDSRAAAFVHEESSYIAKRVQAAAFERRVSVLLDGTGDGSIAGLSAKIEAAKASGYQVRGYYATISVDEAIKRSTLRAARSGREVPIDKITITHANVSKVFPTAASSMDEIFLYDTTTRTPRVIAVAKGGILKVLDEDAFAAFMRKAGQ
jgi:SPP1 gp7 family putative phage head morphogenesis protein